MAEQREVGIETEAGGCVTHSLIWLAVSILIIVLILAVSALCWGLYRLTA